MYPEIKPFNDFFLDVTGNHSIYVEECGNPEGIPLIFIHGGPGAGCSADDRRFFNPDKYRIILFDQRGCGRSKPLASIQNNTTTDLINDIESIKRQLNIEKWIVFGGSWGSTLSIVYAENFADSVSALVLRGIFLATAEEIGYLNSAQSRRYYPEEYLKYANFIDENKRDNLQLAYYEMMNNGPDAKKIEAAKYYRDWELNSAFLSPPAGFDDANEPAKKVLAESLIQCHYMVNMCFLSPGYITTNINRIVDIPTHIVHGRYDLLCAPSSAYELHKLLPQSELTFTQRAGHVSREEGTGAKLVEIMDLLADKLQK